MTWFWITVGLVAFIAVDIIIMLGLCRAASQGDEQLQRALRRRELRQERLAAEVIRPRTGNVSPSPQTPPHRGDGPARQFTLLDGARGTNFTERRR